MLARNFIKPPLQGLAKEEILPVQREHVLVFDSIEDPFGKLDLDIEHAAVAGFLHDFGRVDQTEYLEVFLAALPQVGFDLRALEPSQGVSQQLIAPTRGLPIGGNEQVMRLKPHLAMDLPPIIERGHALADAVNQALLQTLPGGAIFKFSLSGEMSHE